MPAILFHPGRLADAHLELMRECAACEDARGTRWGAWLRDLADAELARRESEARGEVVEPMLPDLELADWTARDVAESMEPAIADLALFRHGEAGELVYAAIQAMARRLREEADTAIHDDDDPGESWGD